MKLKNCGIIGNNLDLIDSFLHKRRRRAALNCESSNWKFIQADVSQGFSLGPLSFLIYVNDLSQGLLADVKLFTNDTSLFFIVYCAKASPSGLYSNLLKIQTNTKINKATKGFFVTRNIFYHMEAY